MRFILLIAALASFSAMGQQQQQPQQSGAKPPAQTNANPAQQQSLTPQEEYRFRAEGAAGGTKPVPPEQREAVGAGAGRHEHFTAPSPVTLPKDEPVRPGN